MTLLLQPRATFHVTSIYRVHLTKGNKIVVIAGMYSHYNEAIFYMARMYFVR
jgi:hypothetical protein